MDGQERIRWLQQVGRDAEIPHISVALNGIMARIIQRACAAGYPPPSFTTDGYDHVADAPKETPPPSTPSTR
jgi:hypothetical protein